MMNPEAENMGVMGSFRQKTDDRRKIN
jgi:hypothetical protein